MQFKGANRQTVDLKICLRDDSTFSFEGLMDGKGSSEMGRVVASQISEKR